MLVGARAPDRERQHNFVSDDDHVVHAPNRGSVDMSSRSTSQICTTPMMVMDSGMPPIRRPPCTKTVVSDDGGCRMVELSNFHGSVGLGTWAFD
ncbi:hypothetical protein V6N13_134796 [Hibiscus sabdariffa]